MKIETIRELQEATDKQPTRITEHLRISNCNDLPKGSLVRNEKNNRMFIFTDGTAVSKDNYQSFQGAYGVVVSVETNHGHLRYVMKTGAYSDDTTVPRMELSAVKTALDYVVKYSEDISEVIIVTDSQLTRDSIVLWMQGWKNKQDENGNWMNSQGQPAKNMDLFKKVDAAITYVNSCTDVTLSFHHINSHIKSLTELKKAHNRYNRFNNVSIDIHFFMELVKGNEEVDELANNIYENKGENK